MIELPGYTIAIQVGVYRCTEVISYVFNTQSFAPYNPFPICSSVAHCTCHVLVHIPIWRVGYVWISIKQYHIHMFHMFHLVHVRAVNALL